MAKVEFIVSLLLIPLAPQEEDVYRTLSVGDRVRITFRNGNSIMGTLVDPSVYVVHPSNDPSSKGKMSSPKDSSPNVDQGASLVLTYFHSPN